MVVQAAARFARIVARIPAACNGALIGYNLTVVVATLVLGRPAIVLWWAALAATTSIALATHLVQLRLLTGRWRHPLRGLLVVPGIATELYLFGQDLGPACEWCRENARGAWVASPYGLYFNRARDATLFTLFWQGPVHRSPAEFLASIGEPT